jgi:putative membrane protein
MEKNDLSPLLVIVIVFLIGITFISIFFGGGMMGGGMMGGLMGFGGIFMFLPIVFIILLILTLLDRDCSSNNYPQPHPGEISLQILDNRYANGEITREEYLRIKNDLNKKY